MNTRTSLVLANGLRFLKPALPGLLLGQAATIALATEAHPQLRYHPEGEAIVSTNSPDSYNRPLYCNTVWPVVYAGDLPRVAGLDYNGRFGKLDFALKRGNQCVWLHEFSDRTARYLPGRMQWLLSDARFPGLQLTLEVTTVDTGVGFVAQLRSSGAQAGDQVLWGYGGLVMGWGMDGVKQVNLPSTDADAPYEVTARPDGFDLRLINPASHIDNPPPLRVIGRFSAPVEVKTVSAVMPREAGALLTEPSRPGDTAFCVTSPLDDQKPVSMVVQVDCITNRTYSLYTPWKGSDHFKPEQLEPANRKFDQSLKRSPAEEFAAGWTHAEQLGRTVTVQSPDPWFNAQVGASTSAMYGLFVSPTFVHGGSQWRAQMPGWRMMDGATAYGWHKLVKEEAKYYISHLIRESDKTTPQTNASGTMEAPESRFFGKGRIDIDQAYYNFQTQYFEELVRSWRYTNDKELEAILLPALELHLERARECFDPDDDGLYESYINVWPTDSMGYNGGGTVEESSYSYYMHRAAAEMCKNKGDEPGRERHTAQAEKIVRALHEVLWLKRKGYFASYVEQGGNKRVHDDAWLYSQFLPIDHGIATPPEAMRALYYSEWGLKRVPLPYGGELCQTSNWVPSIWSVRELFGGDIYHLALAYFQTGQAEAGWKLLRGTAIESGFGDTVPKPAYNNVTNMMSPGGLSHPNGAIDFNDVTTMFCRTVAEGLFGYTPDYPNGKVTFQPALPPAWNNGSIKTPDFQLDFRRESATDHYQISVTHPAAMTLRLPIYARGLQSVTVNGQPVKAVIEPWYGYARAVIQVPSGTRAEVVLSMLDPRLPQSPATVQAKAGEPLTLEAEAPIEELDDSQGVLEKPEIHQNSVTGRCSDTEGHYLVMGLIKTDAPYWKIWRVEISNPTWQSLQASKNLRTGPAGATFQPVDMSAAFNGDIRTIFQQDYASPRPATASIRLAHDGYQAWTMATWALPAPEIGLENTLIKPPELKVMWEAQDPTAFAYRDEFTLDVWLCPAAMPESGGRIVDRATPGTYVGYMLDTYPGNSLRLLTSNGMLEVPGALPAEVPTRVTAVYSASKHIMKLYKDGELIGSRSDGEFPPLAVTESALRVGSDATGGNRFLGNIQRVRVIPRAWSDEEVAAASDSPVQNDGTEWNLQELSGDALAPTAGTTPLIWRGDAPSPDKPGALLRDGLLVTEEGVHFTPPADGKNVAFTSLWDNWPARVSVPVNQGGEAIWLLVAGFTHPMQGRIANAVLCFRYEDGVEERLDLTPPLNFRSLCRWGPADYNEARDGFALGDSPPLMTQLGSNCRTMLYGWRLRPGVKLAEVSLESLSQEVIIGLMGISLQNPEK